MKKKLLICLVVILVIVCLGFGIWNCLNKKEEPKPETPVPQKPIEYRDTDFNVRLIKTVNSTQNGNYLISPYSIEIALNMLRDGAKNDSYEQIDNLIGRRNITTFNVKNRISVTNGAFIKNEVKDFVNSSYYEKLKGYKAELIYDDFATPKAINDWVNEKTWGMIPSILDSIGKDFVLGIANAVAIDVEWQNQFECQHTNEKEFTKDDGKKINVEMMHNTFERGDTKYFETDDAKGVIIPYRAYDASGVGEYETKEKDLTRLEFVGILPNGNVGEYVNNLDQDKLTKFDEKVTTTKDADIAVALPRFSYSFNYEKFADGLQAMGINDVFDPEKADLTDIFSRDNISKMNADNIYVSVAIHKTYIDLNEKGTKAAAITFFGVDKASAIPVQRDVKRIEFNKPFVYMIRDSKTKELLFFGVVKEPNIWKGSTCVEK